MWVRRPLPSPFYTQQCDNGSQSAWKADTLETELEVRILSAAPYAVVAQYGESAEKRLLVASPGSRSTERQTEPKLDRFQLLKCVGKRVILKAMLRKRERVRFPSTAPTNCQQVSKSLYCK